MRRTWWAIALGLAASGCLLPKLDASRESESSDSGPKGGAGGGTSDSGGDSTGGSRNNKNGNGGTAAYGSGGLSATGSTSNGGRDAGSSSGGGSNNGGFTDHDGGGDGGAAADGGTSSGGSSATGGTAATGGHAGNGGTVGSGGTLGSGGSKASGGTTATGGTAGSGGSSSGGTTGAGGTSCASVPLCTVVGPTCKDMSNVISCSKDAQGCFHESTPTPCTGGKTCQSGACSCPAAKPATCSSTCTDTTTDPANCGRCGHSCRGGSCSNSECQPITLASGRTAPWALAVNASGVYWIETSSVLAVPLNGGTVVTLASSGYITEPWDIAASASTVYYSNSGNGLNVTNYNDAVMKVAATGGTAPSTFAQIKNISAPRNVAVVSGNVYWTDQQWQSLYQAPESTGTYTFLYNGSGGFGPMAGFALDATNFYATDASGALFQFALSGSGPLVSLLGVPGPNPRVSARINQIAAVQGFVYFTTGDWTKPATSTQANSALYKIPVGGGTLTQIASGLAVTPALAADSSGVYFDDGSLKRVPLDGSAIQTVVTGQNAGFIELDATFIYVTDASSGVVKKVAK